MNSGTGRQPARLGRPICLLLTMWTALSGCQGAKPDPAEPSALAAEPPPDAKDPVDAAIEALPEAARKSFQTYTDALAAANKLLADVEDRASAFRALEKLDAPVRRMDRLRQLVEALPESDASAARRAFAPKLQSELATFTSEYSRLKRSSELSGILGAMLDRLARQLRDPL
ncbi:MAG: hypothetical protein SFZ24_00135 [Planctomycetota bacterium]|nr:hypothetical protein [Planctomycetota bacterium]